MSDNSSWFSRHLGGGGKTQAPRQAAPVPQQPLPGQPVSPQPMTNPQIVGYTAQGQPIYAQAPQAPQALVQQAPVQPQQVPQQFQGQQFQQQQVQAFQGHVHSAAELQAYHGGEAARMNPDPCPSCGGNQYFAHVKRKGRGPEPAGHCYNCGYNELFDQGDQSSWGAVQHVNQTPTAAAIQVTASPFAPGIARPDTGGEAGGLVQPAGPALTGINNPG